MLLVDENPVKTRNGCHFGGDAGSQIAPDGPDDSGGAERRHLATGTGSRSLDVAAHGHTQDSGQTDEHEQPGWPQQRLARLRQTRDTVPTDAAASPRQAHAAIMEAPARHTPFRSPQQAKTEAKTEARLLDQLMAETSGRHLLDHIDVN